MLLITNRENRILQTTNDSSILYFCVDMLENLKLQINKSVLLVPIYVINEPFNKHSSSELIRVDIIKMSHRTIFYHPLRSRFQQ